MMQESYTPILEKLEVLISERPNDLSIAEDYLSACRAQIDIDQESGIKHVQNVMEYTLQALRNHQDSTNMNRLYELRKKALLLDAPYHFDSYMQYLEWNRAARDRFYLPRRKVLKCIVDNLQRFVDDELDEFFVSLPARTGKSTILMFFNSWIIGRNPESSNLYCAFSDIITSAFYRGTLEIITDPDTYNWKDVFPNAELVETNAKDETLNINRKKRYPSLTCRSLYGTLNGACDCNGILIADDLIGGIEEALSKDRLASAWAKTDNNMIPRAKQNAKLLWCGTRWAESDPMGLRIDLLTNDAKFKNRRYEIINIPALNSEDESNFDYPYDVGFSTEYYHQRRASFERNNDMASWLAQYCGEPIERTGSLFAPDDMKYYNGVLPDGEPDRIFMAVDPSWGGGDYVAGPICYDYDGTVYVADVVYHNGEKTVTRAMIANKVIQHGVKALQIEANKMTEDYKDIVEEELRNRGHRLNITSRPAPSNKAKVSRILDKAAEIREFYFLESGKRSKEYELFMQNVFSFKFAAKNKNDDAPDSLAMAADMHAGTNVGKAVFFKRKF